MIFLQIFFKNSPSDSNSFNSQDELDEDNPQSPPSTDEQYITQLDNFIQQLSSDILASREQKLAIEEKEETRRKEAEEEIKRVVDEPDIVIISETTNEKTRKENLREREKRLGKSPEVTITGVSGRSKSPRRRNFSPSGRRLKSSPSPRRRYREERRRRTPPRRRRSRTPSLERRSHRLLDAEEKRRRKRDEARERKIEYERKLKDWEDREVRKARIYRNEDNKIKSWQEDCASEAKKLWDFFVEYNDIIMDKKYYTYDKYREDLKKFF